MDLSMDLLSKFVKATNDKPERKTESFVSGTAIEYDGRMFVRLDGSDRLTPVSSSASVKDGNRVTVMIKNHEATVTGNTSDPSASSGTVGDLGDKVEDANKQIAEFEIIVADRITAQDIEAVNGYFDKVIATLGQYTGLEAITAEIETLKAKYAEMDHITATDVDIINAEIDKITGEFADFTQISAEDIEAMNAEFENLKAYNADFTYVSAEKLTALKAEIVDLEVNKLSVADAELTYANIDFANIGEAAIEKLFADSGIIKDLVVSEGHITGELVGVTIKGDLIEGGTVVADKLVIKGSDGLYYKLNTNGVTTEAEQTEYNSLDGSVITAKSITATKINVDDLVAFDATIGGFKITEDSLYSGIKEDVNNTTRGVYLDNTGQVAFGDASNYLKYFLDTDGKWKLAISAQSIKFGVSGESLEDELADATADIKTEYYLSTSRTALSGGSWSETAPAWTPGKYIWTRTKTVKKSGATSYSQAVCVSGNDGQDGTNGIPGPAGQDGQDGADGKTSYLHIAYANSADGTSGFSVSDSVNKLYIGQYTDFIQADSTDPTKYSWTKIKGEQGSQGIQGKPGADGKTYYTWLKYADTPTSGMSDSPDGKKYMGLAYNKASSTESSNYADYTWSLIKGEDGVPGEPGTDGKTLYTWVKYADSASGAGMSDSPDGKKYIGLAYNKTTASESTNAADYSWSLIKGADGAAGVGVKSSTVTYQAGSSGTTIPTGSWSTSIPTVAAGQYLWTKTVITYTDNKSTTSYSIGRMGQNGSAGAAGKPGADGKGVKSTAVTYQAAANGTTVPTGTWVTAVPATSADKPYLWTRTIITYTDNTTSTSYSVGSTPEGIVIGGRNLVLNSKESIQSGTINPEKYQIAQFNVSDMPMVAGAVYTVQINVTNTVERNCLIIYRGGGDISLKTWVINGPGTNTYTATITISENQANRPDAANNFVNIYSSTTGGTQGTTPIEGSCTVNWIKIETGNKATDWTPAPEDVESGITDAQNSADSAGQTANNALTQVTEAKASLEILNNSISSLVTGPNGESLMTQTENGWTFNMGSVQTKLDEAVNDIQTIEGDIGAVTDLANKTNQLANDISAKTAYINMTTDETGGPVLELGKSDNLFKVRITNTSIDFMEGSNKIAYITNRSLYIQSSVVTDEMKVGNGEGYIWKRRDNGNMGLRYVPPPLPEIVISSGQNQTYIDAALAAIENGTTTRIEVPKTQVTITIYDNTVLIERTKVVVVIGSYRFSGKWSMETMNNYSVEIDGFA